MLKHWKGDEIALACQAYVGATLNPITGADQDFVAFTSDLLKKYEALSPNVCEEGTYYKRGDRVYPYLRDNVFPEIQKFQKSLRLVHSSYPSGVTEDEIVCMAVAIHCNETESMEYRFKTYDCTKWKLYAAWNHLEKLPKFHSTAPPNENDNQTLAILKRSSRGVGRGKKAAIASQIKEEQIKRKREREEQRDKHFEKLVVDFTEVKQLIKKKSMSSILTNAIKSSNDPEVKDKLNGKLIKLALDLDVE